MPTMLRVKGKPKKIAERILGISFDVKKKRPLSKIKKRLNAEETVRVR